MKNWISVSIFLALWGRRQGRVFCTTQANAKAKYNAPPSSCLPSLSSRFVGCSPRLQFPPEFVLSNGSQVHRVKTSPFFGFFCFLLNGFLVSPIIMQVSGYKFSMLWHQFLFSSWGKKFFFLWDIEWTHLWQRNFPVQRDETTHKNTTFVLVGSKIITGEFLLSAWRSINNFRTNNAANSSIST